MAVAARQAPRERRPERSTVSRLRFFESDRAIVAAVRAGRAAGGAALYDRHHRFVRKVLLRVLGPGGDLDDLTQDVFVTAIDAVDRLEEPDALRGWLAGIAVNTARAEIRRRIRARWFPLFAQESLPDVAAPASTPETDEAVRTTYRILDKLPAKERIPFALRYVEGMELVEVADACRVSLTTVKRRLRRAQKKFATIARTYPALETWLEEGQRWT